MTMGESKGSYERVPMFRGMDRPVPVLTDCRPPWWLCNWSEASLEELRLHVRRLREYAAHKFPGEEL